MDKLNEYLDSQIKKINKWDKNRTISDYGRGKLKAFEEIKEHLLICAVMQVKPEVCQCYNDDIGMYLKGIEYYCAKCDLPIKAN